MDNFIVFSGFIIGGLIIGILFWGFYVISVTFAFVDDEEENGQEEFDLDFLPLVTHQNEIDCEQV